jgi:stage II sporulation protein Q
MKPEEPKKNKVSFLEENKPASQQKKQPLLYKKLFFPAIYLSLAVCVLGAAWWYQQNKKQEVVPANTNVDTVLPVEEVPTDDGKQLSSPVSSDPNITKTMDFYDANANDQAKADALVQYASTYWPHTGIDFALKNGKTFDVIASASGKVIRVEKNPVLGQVVEILHENGLTTIYQSLANVKVKPNQSVVKGDVIAQAGQNVFEKSSGVHLHFEVRKQKQVLNPNEYIK